jgi:hypothetical protein
MTHMATLCGCSMLLLGATESNGDTNKLHGTQPFVNSCQLGSYSRTSQYFMKPDDHYRVHRSPPLVPVLSQIEGIHPGLRPFVTFHNKLIFYGVDLLPHAQPPSWRITPCRMSVTDYSIHLQLHSIFGGHLLHLQPEDTPCRVGDSTFMFTYQDLMVCSLAEVCQCVIQASKDDLLAACLDYTLTLKLESVHISKLLPE